MALFLISEGF
jgi:hypothetical protein